MSAKVLVTGATGFLGREVVPRLVAAGHDVRAMSRREGAHYEGATAVVGDVLEPETLGAALEGCEVVVHAAGLVSHHPEDARRCWMVHVAGTENVLDAARDAGVKRVVYLSTSGTLAVSEDADAVADESGPDPLMLIKEWPYYRSKYFAEQAAMERSGQGLEVVCLNPSLLLGPGDSEGESTRPVRLFLDDQVPAAPPGGLSFVDVRDVADAVAAAITRGRGGRRYLLGGANLTFSEFYARLARLSNKSAPPTMPKISRDVLRWIPKLGRDGIPFAPALNREEVELACYTWYVDSGRAGEELGWTPRDPTKTLVDTIQDILGARAW